MEQALIKITGQVQGVFFRASAREQALKLHLKGHAKNLPDGSVEVLAQGERAQIEQLITWCEQGPTEADVENIQSYWQTPTAPYKGFAIQ